MVDDNSNNPKPVLPSHVHKQRQVTVDREVRTVLIHDDQSRQSSSKPLDPEDPTNKHPKHLNQQPTNTKSSSTCLGSSTFSEGKVDTVISHSFQTFDEATVKKEIANGDLAWKKDIYLIELKYYKSKLSDREIPVGTANQMESNYQKYLESFNHSTGNNNMNLFNHSAQQPNKYPSMYRVINGEIKGAPRRTSLPIELHDSEEFKAEFKDQKQSIRNAYSQHYLPQLISYTKVLPRGYNAYGLNRCYACVLIFFDGRFGQSIIATSWEEFEFEFQNNQVKPANQLKNSVLDGPGAFRTQNNLQPIPEHPSHREDSYGSQQNYSPSIDNTMNSLRQRDDFRLEASSEKDEFKLD